MAEVSDHAASLSELEDALKANDIQVSEGAVQQLLDQKGWIYQSERVEKMMEKLNEEQLYSVFNSQHHLQSSTHLLNFLASMTKKVSVIYGHKAQGKTQFLFFLFKLLQAMGEKVLFLDNTILPLGYNNRIGIKSSKFCGHLWKDEFLQISDDNVQDTLKKFYKDALSKSFGEFLFALWEHTVSSRARVWIVVDEVVLFNNFHIQLPDEQNLGPFHWIVTGSAGIGSWVANKHLEKLVFDLPLFNKDECFDFANNLCNSLGINLENGIDGVPPAGVDDWLEERFGGVVGYIAELFLDISKGSSVSQYMSVLSDRVGSLIVKAAGGDSLVKQLSQAWLDQLKSPRNNWRCLRDAGLCGSSPPRGILFSLILEWLCTYAPVENELSLVASFRSMFSDDPGLDGCLLELEEILKLKAKNSIGASLLTTSNDKGWIVKESIDLPPTRIPLSFLVYQESHSKLVMTPNSASSSWYLIQVPSGFDVIDVVLVDESGSPAIYGIQITRSAKPFAKHYTFDTCLPRSKERLEKLWSVIIDYFELDNSVEKFYVMLAPNCERDKFKPPKEHSSDYYFAPATIITEHGPFKSKKRRKAS